MYISTPQDWATSLFGQANLGDPRRTKRLVKVATNLALHTGKSLVKSSQQPAEIEDTTSLNYTHRAVKEQLGHVNGGNRTRGIYAHSILLFAPSDWVN